MPVPLKVCHVAMGDLWAGAEVQLLTFLRYGIRTPNVEWSVVLFNEGRLADEIRRLCLPLTVISEKDYGPLGIADRLAKTFRGNRPDIVHTHKYKDSILGALVAKSLRIPYVVRVVHGMPEPFRGIKHVKMAGYMFVDRCIGNLFVDKVIAVSRDIEGVLVQRYGAERVVFIHNGIDLDSVQTTLQSGEMRRRWCCSESTVVIGTVGRLVPVKGHATLLEAFRRLLGSIPSAKLLVVGEGPLGEQLQGRVKQMGLEQVVIFAGHQEQVHDFINMMDIFVLPSLHEGIPMVLLEALAMGKAVIASAVGGIPEVVSHGYSGILMEPGDTMQLVESLKELIYNRDKATALGVAGRKMVEQEFDARLMVDRTVETYKSLSK